MIGRETERRSRETKKQEKKIWDIFDELIKGQRSGGNWSPEDLQQFKIRGNAGADGGASPGPDPRFEGMRETGNFRAFVTIQKYWVPAPAPDSIRGSPE
jgi:hypothetical protein